jgi:hypothetical protein
MARAPAAPVYSGCLLAMHDLVLLRGQETLDDIDKIRLSLLSITN